MRFWNADPRSLPRQRLSNVTFVALTVMPWVALLWLIWPRG
jgi:hypothetical protein